MRVALLAGVAAAIASAWPTAARADCGVALDWNGARYAALALDESRAGRTLGRGVLPACDDGNGPRAADRKITVRALRGVAPHYAVAGEGRVFVDPAYPLRLPQHPLHGAVYGHRRWPTCRPTRHVTAVGEFESLHDVMRIDAERGPRALYVDDRTRMAPRFGPLAEGDRIRVAAAECRFAGGPSVPFARVVTVLARAPEDATGEPDVLRAAAITAAILALGVGARALLRR